MTLFFRIRQKLQKGAGLLKVNFNNFWEKMYNLYYIQQYCATFNKLFTFASLQPTSKIFSFMISISLVTQILLISSKLCSEKLLSRNQKKTAFHGVNFTPWNFTPWNIVNFFIFFCFSIMFSCNLKMLWIFCYVPLGL